MIHDLIAEQAMLGAAMASPEQTRAGLEQIPDEAWFRPSHGVIAAAINRMLKNGVGVDPVSLLAELSEAGCLSKVGGAAYLHTLYAMPYVADHAVGYAARIVDLWHQRRLAQTVARAAAIVEQAERNGEGADTAEAVQMIRDECDEALSAALAEDYQPRSLADVLAVEESYNWLVPGLLERGERIVLTGGEGCGKSVLISQFAATMCGGVHPFTGTVLGDGDQGLRVLVVDAENSETQTRRRYRRIVRNVDDTRLNQGMEPVDWRTRFFVEIRPEGLDLTQPADLAWLNRAAAATAPDLLVLGPLYRLHAGDPSDEQLARKLVAAIDSVRVRHNCSLITEAHAGHAQDGLGDRRMRPAGSSLWLRWPEFGYGLRRAKDMGELTPEQELINRDRPVKVDVVAWRGARESRSWPIKLQHGRVLPWVPADSSYHPDHIQEF